MVDKPHGHKTSNGFAPWNKGIYNRAFKGTHSEYTALHAWVMRRKGRPKICENCGQLVTIPRGIHWANRSKLYKREVGDWIRLCVKCHVTFDKIV